MKLPSLSIAGRITIIYLLLGIIYIVVSDTLLLDLEKNISSEELTYFQTIKGIGYVFISGLLLYFLIRHFVTQLRRSERQYHDLFRSNPLPMVILDNDQKNALQINKAGRNLIGIKKEDSLKKIDRFLSKSEILLKIKQDEKDQIISFKDRLNNQKIVQINFTDITFELKEAKLITLEDVTEREMSRQEIVELNTTLQKEAIEKNELVKQLMRQNRDLEEYAMILNHYLREPIVEIMGLTDYLLKTKKMEEETLNHLKSSVRKLDNVIKNTNETIATKTYESNKAKPLKLNEILSQAKERIQKELANIDGSISIQVSDDQVVYGNEHFLRSALTQLFNNAIQFGSDLNLKINVNCERDENECRIKITDNGVGFDSEKYGDEVFKMYKRLHSEKSGRGFGLYLVKQQIEMMDGEISVNSKPGKGTTFQIKLPTSRRHYL